MRRKTGYASEMEEMMNRIVYKSKAIQMTVLIAGFCLLISLWPLRLFSEIVSASLPSVTGTMTAVIDNDKTVLQSFVAQYDHLDNIRLYVGEDSQGESFYVRLLNEEQVMLAEEEVSFTASELPGYVEVLMDVETEVGKTYHCIVQGNDSEIFLGCEQISMEAVPYAGLMYYDGQTLEGMNLVADYDYIMPLRKGKVFLYGALIILAAGAFYGLTGLYYKKKGTDKLLTVEDVFRHIANPAAAVFTVVCLSAVLLGACGSYALDNTVFFISVVLLSLILFYGINHDRRGQESVVTADYVREHFQDILQSLCIAGAISGCCEYMAGLYDIHHSMAERKEMLWFALAIVVMFQWKELFNLYNLVYAALAGVLGYFYYQNEVAKLAEKTIKETEYDWHLQVIRHTVLIGILVGLIVLRTVIGLAKKKLAKPAPFYGGLLALFFGAIIVFRNGRWWTVVLAAGFTLFYLNYGMWEHKERLLVNVCRGIIWQFLLATGFALLHRPYTTYRSARYPHIFHTVTITATYLTMVECAALVILLSKYRRSRKLRDIWKELVLLGVVSSYMIFTMARTGFLAVGVTGLFAVLLMAEGKGKAKLLYMGRTVAVMVLAVAVCLPVTFTLQRSIPALVSDPYEYEIEDFRDATMRGRKLSSHEFMRVGRFIDLFADRVLGIPEGTFDFYGEIAEYQRTHGIVKESSSLKEEIKERFAELTLPASLREGELVASSDHIPEELEEEDYTNGRMDIFRSYIEQLNTTGHEEMGALLQDGSIATHAHNIYLQVAYDHGVYVGILFVIVGMASLFKACLYYRKKKETVSYAAMPAVVIICVAAAGVVEWIFHISNPCGFVLMLVIAPLLFEPGKKRK